MDAIALLTYSISSAFDILGQVTADLTQQQADWIPPGTANPIGALYWHTISGADQVVHEWCQGQEALTQREGWQGRVLLAGAPGDGQETLGEMQAMRVDLPALHDYARAVAEASQGWLSSLQPQDLGRELQTPIGNFFLAHVLETFVIWHINAHCGEISALKGCQGARGYPF
jgi:hypothetical protein